MKINRRTLLAGGASLAVLPHFAAEALGDEVAIKAPPVPKVVLTAMIKAKPGEEDAVKEILLALVEPTRKEAGCLCYNLHQSKSDKRNSCSMSNGPATRPWRPIARCPT